jgi:hypothetical protein
MSLNQRNLTSIVSVKLLPKDDITSMPDLNLAQNKTVGAVIHIGYWRTIDFTVHSAVYKEKFNKGRGFGTWQIELTGKHVEKQRFLFDELNKRYIMDIEDANGTRLLVGTDQEPLVLSMEQDSGQPSSGRFATLAIGGELSRRPPMYNP